MSEQMQRDGVPVRFLRSIFAPEDEACFFLYEAPSVEAVWEAAARAGLRYERVAETIAQSEGERT